MTRRKRLNVTRKQGRIYFRRETRHYHDGTPLDGRDGEVLWVFSSNKKPRKVSFVTRDWCKTGEVYSHLGTYRRSSPVQAAKMIRQYLFD